MKQPDQDCFYPKYGDWDKTIAVKIDRIYGRCRNKTQSFETQKGVSGKVYRIPPTRILQRFVPYNNKTEYPSKSTVCFPHDINIL